MHRLCLITLATLVGSFAAASVVDRSQVTLGALTEASHAIAQVTVSASDPARVQLTVDDTLKGTLPATIWLPRGEEELAWAVGEQWLVFLSHNGADWRPLSSSWHRVAKGGQDFAQAVRSRLPTLTGAAGELQTSLFSQLDSTQPRIAADAALDLLGFQSLTPNSVDLAALERALGQRPTGELFHLCARVAHPALAGTVLRAARGVAAGDVALEPAAAALMAVDAVGSLNALGADLAGPEAAAMHAIHLLGDMGQRAHSTLHAGLQDSRPDVRAAAIRSLARSETPLAQAQASALLNLARQGEPSEQRLALAALARVGPAALLKAVAREHPDLSLRALAEALRRDPSELPRRILGE